MDLRVTDELGDRLGAVLGFLQGPKRRSGAQEYPLCAPVPGGRLLASFLLRQAELAGRALGCSTVLVDAKARNTGIRRFLLSQRYRVAGTTDLYELSSGDVVVYTKLLKSTSDRL